MLLSFLNTLIVSGYAESSVLSLTGDGRLTVMTWNLEWFFDDQQGDNHSELAKEKSSPSRAAWNWRRDAIAQSIAKARPTILAVQEVESRRVLWYLTRALARNHKAEYHEIGIEGRDHFTEQDVGLLIRPPVDTLSAIQYAYPKRMRSSNQYYDVSKHLMAVLELRHEKVDERVLVMNVHLRSGTESAPIRLRQARLIRHWIKDALRDGQNVILLGDFNTEQSGTTTRIDSEMGIVCGMESADEKDNLVDLNLRLPHGNRQTHLIGGRQFDRILCSKSLIEDDPSRPDLVFTGIEILSTLAIRGMPDSPDDHWDRYWQLPERERDLSDHYPVMATFEVR